MTASPNHPERAARLEYGPLGIDEAAGVLRCRYLLDGRMLEETVQVGPGREWNAAAREAARIVHLLAGVSYYKAGAPPVIDLGDTPVRDGERDFLRGFYLDGLGEFAHRNGLDLGDLQIVGGAELSGPPAGAETSPERPLVPFGGGIDSIVAVEAVRPLRPDAALFVVNRSGVAPFEAIERAAAVTGLPVVRAEREVDDWILRPPAGTAVFNGHVPITGVLSAIAVLVALLEGRGAVVMSNEWSASRPNLVVDGRPINHQYSKSDAFETGFRAVLAGAVGDCVDYFSYLRPFSELWVARRFATLDRYHPVFHSCNRAFHLDPARRLDRWCGHCDKCCFIDLILAPYMSRAELSAVFDGAEPIADPGLLGTFRSLLGLGDGRKPFECVGDVDECRTAAVLASDREDRAGSEVLTALCRELGPDGLGAARAAADPLMQPLGSHHLPHDLATAALR